ncbi:protein THYLAKOID ASSEMBLY 8-like, chloroplastic isoform X2 [Coffea arabica]|uniref:Protein THYLAKOID ASSEMBLY 8-like, chloroplastic isoform X2 n=1 Tax=Coffea arabica TaxID=13443 RepID=A0A6P6WWT0_COFAR|nr:protein THYLAKOID ASSEMBLY 8-like, chloroplastic isoform X3 [Coffea arabica]
MRVEKDWTKKTMWRSRVLSPEAIQAVQSLKLAKSPGKLAEVFANRISRLMKADLLDTLYELQRQNEVELALQSSNIEMAEQLFGELEKEGLRPDTRTYTEMIGAYFRIKMIEKAMESNESMKGSGCVPDKLTFRILIKNLEKTGKKELIATVKKDCLSYIKYPEKFLEEVEKTYPKRRLLNVV